MHPVSYRSPLVLALVLICIACSTSYRPAPTLPVSTPVPSMLLEDFHQDLNPFGGSSHCEAANGAELECLRQADTLRLTYAGVAPGAYGIWWTDLQGAGANLSPDLLLVLQLRGAKGGERPNLYLEDQKGVRGYVEVTRYADITPQWKTVYIPLQDFADKQGNHPDLSRLSSLAIAFEFEKQDGQLFVDDVRAQPSSIVETFDGKNTPPSELAAVHVPAGFSVSVYADTHLSQITRLGFDPKGHLTFTRRNGQAYVIDGDQLKLIASGFDELLGFAWRGAGLFLSSCQRVTAAQDLNGDGYFEDKTDLLGNLPCGGHQTNGLAFSPDGWLYIAQGDTVDRTAVNAPWNGTLLRIQPENAGSGPDIFATGLRNMYALTFSPSGDIFGTDNGPDVEPGDDELNLLVQHGDYGYPNYFGQPPPGSGTLGPVVTFPQHASPEGLAFYEANQFPAAYRGDLFVALFGQFFGTQTVGHKLVRVELTREGDHYRAEVSDFATGLDRPIDVAVGPDGALYVAEFLQGVIYRIAYG